MKCLFCKQEYHPSYSIKDLLFHPFLGQASLCPNCSQALQKVDAKEEHCPYCGHRDVPCQECELWRKQYHLQHQSLYYYDDWGREFMERYKIKGEYSLRHCFQKEIYIALHSYQKEGFILCPIPLTKTKREQRGFSQVEGLLEASHLSYCSFLEKIHEETQGLKNKVERLKTPYMFALKEGSIVQNKKICLVDDIYTTGRTITYGYDCLQKGGAKEVVSFSLWRA